MENVYIGTSGYSYSYWKNRFYPGKLPSSGWLRYYSTRFNTLELNNTFYRFPVAANLRKMAEQTPEDFRFSVKANKVITHTMRMRNVQEKLNDFNDIVREGLGEKLSCILYQLPPSYAFTDERMDDILSNTRRDTPQVIEFRHASWWDERVYGALREHTLNFCSVSYPGLPEEEIITGPVYYKRMHGVPELFKSSYCEKVLQTLADRIPANIRSFIYFNNTMFEAGYTNAARLKELASV